MSTRSPSRGSGRTLRARPTGGTPGPARFESNSITSSTASAPLRPPRWRARRHDRRTERVAGGATRCHAWPNRSARSVRGMRTRTHVVEGTSQVDPLPDPENLLRLSVQAPRSGRSVPRPFRRPGWLITASGPWTAPGRRRRRRRDAAEVLDHEVRGLDLDPELLAHERRQAQDSHRVEDAARQEVQRRARSSRPGPPVRAAGSRGCGSPFGVVRSEARVIGHCGHPPVSAVRRGPCSSTLPVGSAASRRPHGFSRGPPAAAGSGAARRGSPARPTPSPLATTAARIARLPSASGTVNAAASSTEARDSNAASTSSSSTR